VATIRQQWDDLPDVLHKAIEAHSGAVHRTETAGDGFNSEIAATLHTETGTIFVKGLRSDHPRVWTQQREAAVNPHVSAIAPRLLWHVVEAGWDLLGFEHIPGRAADYAPGCPDLPLVVDAMTPLGRILCPDLPLKDAEQRWAAYLDDPADARHFAGSALLHTEWNPTNVLVSDGARVVDWAWSTRGAAWIDPACWVVWLTAAGHTPRHAEQWAAKVPAWTTAPTGALDLFATAQARLWQGIAEESPNEWTRRLADAATRWAACRRGA
jgi:hypothetical protein